MGRKSRVGGCRQTLSVRKSTNWIINVSRVQVVYPITYIPPCMQIDERLQSFQQPLLHIQLNMVEESPMGPTCLWVFMTTIITTVCVTKRYHEKHLQLIENQSKYSWKMCRHYLSLPYHRHQRKRKNFRRHAPPNLKMHLLTVMTWKRSKLYPVPEMPQLPIKW